jgi:hypothetical protein
LEGPKICKFYKKIYLYLYLNFRKDYDVLEFVLDNLQSHLFQVLDGCILCTPVKTEIVKIYSEIFNPSYLLIVQKFWSSCYSNMDVIFKIYN